MGRALPRTRINASAIWHLVRPPVTACVFISLRSAAAVTVDAGGFLGRGAGFFFFVLRLLAGI